jgi:hypothetical protein
MHLIMTSRERLRRRYSDAGLLEIERALDDLVEARAAAGIDSLRYDVEVGLPELGVVPAPLSWQGLVAQLGVLAAALRARGGRVESLLIVGGPDIVPFGVLPNPMFDSDPSLPADCVYGSDAGVWPLEGGADTHGYGTDWPVGRLPDADEPTPALLLGLIAVAAAQHRRGPLALTPCVAYSNAAWQAASEAVLAAALRGAPQALLLSPPLAAEGLDTQPLVQARLIYVNLHGVADTPNWYGQSPDSPALIVALRPSDLAGLQLDAPVVVSEACYGARLGAQSEETSLALTLLARGAAAFIGATAITYGPLQPPNSQADLLALHMLRQLQRKGASVGQALMAARLATLRETVLAQGTLDEDDEKTLLEFVLYGDPTLRV